MEIINKVSWSYIVSINIAAAVIIVILGLIVINLIVCLRTLFIASIAVILEIFFVRIFGKNTRRNGKLHVLRGV